MEFLKNNRRISFLYDGKTIDEAGFKITQDCTENTVTTVYEHADGFKLTNIARKIEKFGAYEWVNYLENTSDKPTGLITELCDCDCEISLPHEDEREISDYYGDSEKHTRIYVPSGSDCSCREFYHRVDETLGNRRTYHIFADEEKEYYSIGGESSSVTYAPFFNVNKTGTGVVFAIGWTGKWNCRINRNAENVRIRTKVNDTHFRLYSNEKVRTSSVVIMPYTADYTDSQNMWRRLVKEEFSLIGSEGRDKYGPLCAMVWGGEESSTVINKIEEIKESKLPFEYLWMDAGWFGKDTKPTHSSFDGDWWDRVGDWTVSKHVHPNELVDVSEAVHDAGMKFLLWFEIERSTKNTPIVQEKPEWFLKSAEFDNAVLLNLGNPEAWDYAFKTLADNIEKLNIDCYRQDFNMGAMTCWRGNDWCDRQGITEIKHINGLYKLWDALLEKFPHLIIDNCAAGGRRIDIEMLRRSMPLWRSDAQCPADFDAIESQFHDLAFNTWMPYSGTGTGKVYDMYAVRSSYGASLAGRFFKTECHFEYDDEKLEFIRKFTNEYLRVRPYFSEDFYPLTEPSDTLDAWCAAQFDRPAEKDGMVQVFRRENSPYPKAVFDLHNIDENATYTITDIDTEESVKISGKELKENGFSVETEKRSAKIFLYSYN